jgi:hypothetical protein
MNIEKFKLIDNGLSGIQFKGTEVVKKDGGAQIMVDLDKTYHVPVPREIVTQVQLLKYFFLQMTGFWPENGDKFLNEENTMADYTKVWDREWYGYTENLFRMTTITGFTYTSSGVIITAKLKGVEDMTYAVNTPLLKPAVVTVGFEDDLVALLIDIKKTVTNFIEDVKFRKMAPKQYMMDLAGEDEQERDRVQGLTEEEAEKEQIEKLQKKGFIVFQGEEVMGEILDQNNAPAGEWSEESPTQFQPGDGEKSFEPLEEKPEEQKFMTVAEGIEQGLKEEDKAAEQYMAAPTMTDIVTEIPETAETIPTGKSGKMKPKHSAEPAV